MIVFDASSIIGAALLRDSVPEKALLQAAGFDVFALSIAVDNEIENVLQRPKFAAAISPERRLRVLRIIRANASWFSAADPIHDCRDIKDNKYLELALVVRT